jgi:predicted dehydrogenase
MNKNLNRRQFVKKTLFAGAGMAAFPTILPATVFPGKNRVMPNDRVNMGMIGVGGMGTGHLRSFLGFDEVRVVAVCDVKRDNRENARKITDEFYGSQECAAYNDYRELLARKDIDAIMQAVPDHWHALIGVEAARRGKAMYFEKPLALTVEESKILRGAMNRYNICFQFGTQQRSDQHFRFVTEMVRNGKLGEIERIIVGSAGFSPEPIPPIQEVPEGVDWEMWLGPAPFAPYSDLRSSRQFTLIDDYSLGCLNGAWGIHHIDIVQWALDADNSGPVEVEGTGTIPAGIFDTYQTFEVEHTYPNGVKVIHIDHISARRKYPRFNIPSSMGILFEGSEGWLYVARGYADGHPKSLLNEVIRPGEIRLPYSNDHRRNFIDAVRTGIEPVSPIGSAVKSEIVCQQAYISLKLDQKLRWDNKNEKFIGNDMANKMLSRPMRTPWHL